MSSLEEQRRLLQLLSADVNERPDTNLEESTTNMTTAAMGTKAVRYLSSKAASSSTLMKTVMTDMVDIIFKSDERLEDQKATSVSKYELSNQKKRILHDKFLTNLQYEGMYQRESIVAVAHEKTFQWIFEREKDKALLWADFCQFLESQDHRRYWITGKPGSGKSTLMKFITQPLGLAGARASLSDESIDLRCTEYLKTWAGDCSLSVACFYFWAAGSQIQTSKVGLFRTLLHQLLSSRTDLIAEIAPARWESLCLFDSDPKPFSEAELRIIMVRTIQLICSTGKVCLFIDGLDEFKGQHGDLVQYFESLLINYRLKICFASRPWVVFEEAFKEQPSLMLQHLTYNDRKVYVTSHFEGNSGFKRLQVLEPAFADSLFEAIVENSEGVFLWVSLVVDSLLDGMRDADRVTDLQKRLNETPRDLEKLFQRMLDDLSPKNLEHAAQYFRFMAACPRPLPAILLSFADEEERDFAIKLPVRRYDWPTFNARIELMRVRLNSCCKGLLELSESQRDNSATTYDKSNVVTVSYLHRTLKDFLDQPGPRETISKAVGPSFDANLRLGSGYLALYKTCHHHLPGQRLSDASWGAMLQCLKRMASLSSEAGSQMTPVLDNFESILRPRLESYASIGVLLHQAIKILTSEGTSMSSTSLIPVELKSNPTNVFPSTAAFLSAAIYCQATPYVMEKVKAGFDESFGTWNPTRAPTGDPHHQVGRASRVSRTLGAMLGNRKDGKQGQGQLQDQTLSIEDWLLYNVIFTGTAGIPIPIPLVELLLRKGARPGFTIQIPHAKIDRDCSTWQLALAAAVYASADNYTGCTPSEVWEEVIDLMLARNASLDRKTVAGSLDVLRQSWNREPRELDRKQMVDEVLRVLRTKRRGHGFLGSIGYTLGRGRA